MWVTKSVNFVVLQRTTAADSFRKPQHFFGFNLAVRDKMKVIRHQNIRESEKLAGFAGFRQGLAGNASQRFRTEDWKSILCDRS